MLVFIFLSFCFSRSAAERVEETHEKTTHLTIYTKYIGNSFITLELFPVVFWKLKINDKNITLR